MGKKNDYIFTIGFNEKDPKHRQAAAILNSMKRGKADYVAEAVDFYQNGIKEGKVQDAVDYEKIRQYVLQVMQEQRLEVGAASLEPVPDKQDKRREGVQIEDAAWDGIFAALDSMRG